MFLLIEEHQNIVGIFTGVFAINNMLKECFDTDQYFIDKVYLKDIDGQGIVTNNGQHLNLRYFHVNMCYDGKDIVNRYGKV